ncbi:MAG: hypothetical protein AAF357_12015 [Verrucomicrobiota bacterium]
MKLPPYDLLMNPSINHPLIFSIRGLLLQPAPLGFLALIALAFAAPLIPSTAWGAFGKLTAVPFAVGVICSAIFSRHIAFRIGLSCLTALSIALFSALKSNGFDWGMDGEWELVGFGMVLHAVFAGLGCFATAFRLQTHHAFSVEEGKTTKSL